MFCKLLIMEKDIMIEDSLRDAEYLKILLQLSLYNILVLMRTKNNKLNYIFYFSFKIITSYFIPKIIN